MEARQAGVAQYGIVESSTFITIEGRLSWIALPAGLVGLLDGALAP